MTTMTKFFTETEDQRLRRERKLMDEFTQRLLSGPEEDLTKFLVSTGIWNENGELTEHYR